MEFLFSLPKTLLDLAVGLLKIKKDDRTRQRLADLLSSVASCVSDIGEAVYAGRHPTEKCAELETYILNIEQFVGAETDKPTAQELTRWLRWVAEAPGLAKIDIERTVAVESKPRWTQAARFAQSQEIARIAGLIRGTANLLRV
jgi:hypothetical protein